MYSNSYSSGTSLTSANLWVGTCMTESVHCLTDNHFMHKSTCRIHVRLAFLNSPLSQSIAFPQRCRHETSLFFRRLYHCRRNSIWLKITIFAVSTLFFQIILIHQWSMFYRIPVLYLFLINLFSPTEYLFQLFSAMYLIVFIYFRNNPISVSFNNVLLFYFCRPMKKQISNLCRCRFGIILCSNPKFFSAVVTTAVERCRISIDFTNQYCILSPVFDHFTMCW